MSGVRGARIERSLRQFIPVSEIRDLILEYSELHKFQLWINYLGDDSWGSISRHNDVVELDDVSEHNYVFEALVNGFKNLKNSYGFSSPHLMTKFNYSFKIPQDDKHLEYKLSEVFREYLSGKKYTFKYIGCGNMPRIIVRLRDFGVYLDDTGLYFISCLYYKLTETSWDVYYTDMEEFQKIENWIGNFYCFPKRELKF